MLSEFQAKFLINAIYGIYKFWKEITENRMVMTVLNEINTLI